MTDTAGTNFVQSRSKSADVWAVHRIRVATALREAREHLGWSQEKFAERAKVSVQTIKNAESGKRAISCITHKNLVDTVNDARLAERPPQPPLVLAYHPERTAGGSLSPHAVPGERDIQNPCLIAIREALRDFSPDDELQKLRIGLIRTPSQLEDLWAIDNTAYGEASITMEQFRAMWEAYPLGLRVLFYGNEIIGAIGLWPLDEVWADKLKQAKIKESQLAASIMRPFVKKPAKYWYISGIVLRTQLIGGRCIKVLVSQGIGAWLKEAKISYPCEMLALASSASGRALLERFGFLLYQKESIMPDGFPLYLHDAASRSIFVTHLKARNLDVS